MTTTPMETSPLPCDHNKPIATCRICGPKARALWKARRGAEPIMPWDLREGTEP